MAEYIVRSRIKAMMEVCGIPAADVAPVVNSRFVDMGGFPACERCGASPAVCEPKPNNKSGYPPYCYSCGAKMDMDAPINIIKEAPDGLDTP